MIQASHAPRIGKGHTVPADRGITRRCVVAVMVAVTATALWGCGFAYVTIPLVPSLRPLEERVITGTGTDKILLLDVSGVLSGRERKRGHLFPGTTIIEDIRASLVMAARDENVRGIVLRIDSPGGTITASDIIHHEIRRIKSERAPVVVACLMDVATSGAYYVATASDKIIAHPTTITGSIGVLAVKFNVEELLTRIGVEDETVRSAEMKDLWSPLRPATDRERCIMQHCIDEYHQRFISTIEEGRPQLTREDIAALADGRIFTARDALEAGLIDDIGYLDDAIGAVKDALGIDKARVVMYHRPGAQGSTIYSKAPDGQSGIIGQTLARNICDGLRSGEYLRLLYLWLPH